jgi:hypothetical protein
MGRVSASRTLAEKILGIADSGHANETCVHRTDAGERDEKRLQLAMAGGARMA